VKPPRRFDGGEDFRAQVGIDATHQTYVHALAGQFQTCISKRLQSGCMAERIDLNQ
jgi:hypothetical protein